MNKKLHLKVSMFSSSPPEVLSKKDAVQIRSKPTGESRIPLPRRTPLGDCSCMSKEFYKT